MELPGLICPTSDQTETIDRLACMMGESFMEENWTRTLLDALDGVANEPRKQEISTAIAQGDFTSGAPYQCCYALPDYSACAGAYLRSDLGDRTWSSIENDATVHLVENVLTPEESLLFIEESHRLRDVSVFDWEEGASQGNDFIHFYMLGVDVRKRGSGAFRRLVEPFFAYADEAGIPCFLETYSENLESLYQHMGVETVDVLTSPLTPLVERCMTRSPRS